MNGIKIAHVINPVKVDKSRDLHFQQPIVFKSMEAAALFARENGLKVELYATYFKEDAEYAQSLNNWRYCDYLTLSCTPKAKPVRRLPYFHQIMDNLYHNTAKRAIDILIQTNADIILQPHFYLMVAQLFEEGFDAFCINKRIVPENKELMEPDALWTLLSSQGQPHNGHDCFVIDRSLYPAFDMGEIIMGTPWSEGTLIANMVYYAKQFYVFKHALATLHIGDRRIWLGHQHDPQRFHNMNETATAILKFAKGKSAKATGFKKHETIRYLISKIKNEIKAYGQENYNEACIEILNTL